MRLKGVHEGVQKCGLVRGSRGARNPMIVLCQSCPATTLGHADELRVP